ncbi:MAG: hypothetical protein ACYCOU_21285, partial [Sulfobacillus sp.]
MQTRFSDWWKRMVSEDRPTLVRLLVVGSLGVGLLAFSGFGSKPSQGTPGPPVDTSSLAGQQSIVGKQLQGILEAIPHVGVVSVAVTLDRTVQSQSVTSNQGLSSPSTRPVVVT